MSTLPLLRGLREMDMSLNMWNGLENIEIGTSWVRSLLVPGKKTIHMAIEVFMFIHVMV